MLDASHRLVILPSAPGQSNRDAHHLGIFTVFGEERQISLFDTLRWQLGDRQLNDQLSLVCSERFGLFDLPHQLWRKSVDVRELPFRWDRECD